MITLAPLLLFRGELGLIKTHSPTMGILNLQQYAARVAGPQYEAPKPLAAFKPSSSNGTASSPSTVVDISKAGRFAISHDVKSSSLNADAATDIESLSLRDLLSRYDFRNITSREMSNLAGELQRREEISLFVAASFTSVEMNTVVERSEHESIDLVAHMKMMLSTAEEASRAEPRADYRFSILYYEKSNQVLSEIMSFVNSDREHISS